MAVLFEQLGCQLAYNLDGGSSAFMTFGCFSPSFALRAWLLRNQFACFAVYGMSKGRRSRLIGYAEGFLMQTSAVSDTFPRMVKVSSKTVSR